MSIRNVSICFLSMLFISCGPGFVEQIQKIEPSQDRTYGYTNINPIKIGYYDQRGSIDATYFYLSKLRTPTGSRLNLLGRASVDDPAGAPFSLPKRFGPPSGGGILDYYFLQAEGMTDTIGLYFDIYRKGPLMVPCGLKFVSTDSTGS
jgi:hypothetical protein